MALGSELLLNAAPVLADRLLLLDCAAVPLGAFVLLVAKDGALGRTSSDPTWTF